MKRFLPIIVLLFSLAVGAQDNVVLESIVPGKAVLFIKSAEVKRLTVSARMFMDTLMPDKRRQKAELFIDGFRRKTGIDLLNADSLFEAGVDVDRGAGIASFGGEGKNEGTAVFIPARDGKNLSMAFVEILKKISVGKEPDVYPAVSEHRGSRVFQVKSDIFMTMVAGYFVVASRGDIVLEVIDIAADGKGSLAGNSLYDDFSKTVKGGFDVDIFATATMIRNIQKRSEEKGQGAGEKAEDSPEAPLNGNAGSADITEKGTEPVTWIDYAFLGITMKKGKLDLNVSIKTNGSDPKVMPFLQSLRPASAKNIPGYKNAQIYSMISLWPDKIESAFGGKGGPAAVYLSGKKKIQEEWGVDFIREFLPHLDGHFCIIGDKGGGLQGSMVNFFSMKSKKSGSMIFNKIADRRKGGEDAGRFGTVKTGGSAICWITDDKMDKTFFAADERGFYTGNDRQLLERLLAAKTVGGGGGLPGGTADGRDDLFTYIFVGKTSNLRTLAMIFAAANFREGGLFPVLSRIGDIFLTGVKKGPVVVMDLHAEIIGGAK